MPQKSSIEWCATYLPDGTIEKGYTSNPIYVTQKFDGQRGWHCDKPGAGCKNCYAETLNKRFGTQLDFHKKNAELLDFHINEKELLEIIKLNDRLAKKGKTANLFPFDMTDLFLAEHPDEFIDKFFATAALCPNINFQILTKRADRMRDYFNRQCTPRLIGYWKCKISGQVPANNYLPVDLPLSNVWLGCSVENQKAADERIPLLLDTPAAVRFLSCEPLLEAVDLTRIPTGSWSYGKVDVMSGYLCGDEPDTMRDWDADPNGWILKPAGQWERGEHGIDWVIIGGDSGGRARPFHIENARNIIRQCKTAGVKAFFKQAGSNVYAANDNGFDGDTDTSFPADTRTEDWSGNPAQQYQGAPIKVYLKSRKGSDLSELPLDLRIREMPDA